MYSNLHSVLCPFNKIEILENMYCRDPEGSTNQASPSGLYSKFHMAGRIFFFVCYIIVSVFVRINWNISEPSKASGFGLNH